MTEWLSKVRRSVSIYTVTASYLAAVVVILLISDGVMEVGVGLLSLAVLSLGVLVLSVRREVRVVHGLVNSQRDELVARVDQLLAALREAHVAVPAGPAGEAPEDSQRKVPA